MSQDIDFRPNGPVRSGTIYVSYKLGKALNMIARAQDHTREELVDAVLSGWLNHNHPTVVEWLEKQEAAEQDFVKTLKI